ncbi:MAG: hypothetical protein GX587_11430 [Bacteroidales bacterium]|nr:hypothetical protein [Bacteroidales bacterium]
MNEIRILGISVFDRIKEAGRVQNILSKNAPLIKTRLGFHELSQDVCSRHGIIVLELMGDPVKWDVFEEELKTVGGIEVKSMQFLL